MQQGRGIPDNAADPLSNATSQSKITARVSACWSMPRTAPSSDRNCSRFTALPRNGVLAHALSLRRFVVRRDLPGLAAVGAYPAHWLPRAPVSSWPSILKYSQKPQRVLALFPDIETVPCLKRMLLHAAARPCQAAGFAQDAETVPVSAYCKIRVRRTACRACFWLLLLLFHRIVLVLPAFVTHCLR